MTRNFMVLFLSVVFSIMASAQTTSYFTGETRTEYLANGKKSVKPAVMEKINHPDGNVDFITYFLMENGAAVEVKNHIRLNKDKNLTYVSYGPKKVPFFSELKVFGSKTAITNFTVKKKIPQAVIESSYTEGDKTLLIVHNQSDMKGNRVIKGTFDLQRVSQKAYLEEKERIKREASK